MSFLKSVSRAGLAAMLAIGVVSGGASASVLTDVPQAGNPSAELAQMINLLNAETGTNEYDNLVLLGKVDDVDDNPLVIGSNSGAGTGLGQSLDVTAIQTNSEGEQVGLSVGETSFTVGGMTYELAAVYVKASTTANIYYDGMFTDMVAPLKNMANKGPRQISHVTYAGLKVDMSVIPVPAALPLLALGLGGLGFAARRQRKARAA